MNKHSSSVKSLFYLIIVCLVITLQGCNKNSEIIEQDVDDPNLVAIEFFNALYNEKNLEKAARACSPRLARIILSYESPTAVARHLFNMTFDTVEVIPDDSGVKVREQFSKEAKLVIFFKGKFNGNRVEDVKRIKMVQNKGMWSVDRILKDPF